MYNDYNAIQLAVVEKDQYSKMSSAIFSTGNEIHDNLDAALTLLAMSLAMPEGAVLFLSADILYGAGNKQESICGNKTS